MTTAFAQRRLQLMNTMTTSDVVIAATAPETIRNGDAHFPFRPHSDFYYCTGFTEPNALMILLPNGHGGGDFILFNQADDARITCWQGEVAGQTQAISQYGADGAYPISQIEDHIHELLAHRHHWWISVEHHPQWRESCQQWQQRWHNNHAPVTCQPLGERLHPMRRIKSSDEIQCIQAAVDQSVQAHIAVMQQCRPGGNEADLAACLWQHMISPQCDFPAYPHIVAAGTNSCILHYNNNNQPLNDGDLLLVDAGSEYHYYAADITRCMPINGAFTTAQQSIYELVLETQEKVIQEIRPGVTFNSLQHKACQVLVSGLKERGIVTGDVDELIKAKAYQPFYMHGIGHWLGLDVHDVGGYGDKGTIQLEPGMVLTVEPGLYLNPQRGPLLEKWHHIGIRIEDDVLVTEDGCTVLSAACPKQPDEIMETMRQ